MLQDAGEAVETEMARTHAQEVALRETGRKVYKEQATPGAINVTRKT